MNATQTTEVQPSWIYDSLALSGQDVITEAAVGESLLVTCNAEQGLGGLVYIENNSRQNLVTTRVVDRLGSSGLWIEPTYYIRSILLSKYMMLIAGGSWGATWVVPSNEASDVHDVRIFQDKLYVVSTGTNEVLQMTIDGKLEDRFIFPGGPDAWHVNCLGVWDNRLVLSSCCRTDTGTWRESWELSGEVFDLFSRQTLWSGLTMPHTPRQLDDGRYLVCDSRNERVLVRSSLTGAVTEVPFPNYFPRGMALGKNHIYVGLSKQRHCIKPGDEAKTAYVAVLEKDTLKQTAEISLPFKEIYDIVILPENNNSSDICTSSSWFRRAFGLFSKPD